MSDRPLRAVKAGEKPPAKKAPAKRAPRTLAHAATLSRKTMLEALRDRIAAAMEDPRAHPRDVANLSKQFLDVQTQLDTLSGKRGAASSPTAEPSAVADTPNEPWDESAVTG